MSRDEFSQPTVLALAKRASFVCSNPECRALTIAPATTDLMAVVYIGKAAHICAAAAKGPSFDRAMTTEQRSGIDNAIFLCAVCADMIDKNGGREFTVERLREWKRQHEEWIRSNLNRRVDSPLAVVDGTHQASGVGNIVGLDIDGPVIIKPGTVVRANGVGAVTGTRIGMSTREKP